MNDQIFWGILIAALVTAFIRGIPILFLAHRAFPSFLQHWLNFVPPAILSAIIAMEIVAHPQVNALGFPVAICATILAFIAGILTRNLLITVLVSIIGYLAFQSF